MESRLESLASRYGVFVDPWAPAQGALDLVQQTLSTAANQGGAEYRPAAGINPLALAVLEHFGRAAEKAAWAAIKEREGWSLHLAVEEEARIEARRLFIEESRRLKRRFSAGVADEAPTRTARRRAARAQALARREARRLKAIQQGEET